MYPKKSEGVVSGISQIEALDLQLSLHTYNMISVYAVSKESSPISSTLQLLPTPRSLSIWRGQTAMLNCPANSTRGDLKITWFFNEVLVSDDDERWRRQHNGSLLIRKFNPKRLESGLVEGVYKCLASNDDGSMISDNTSLHFACM